MYVSFTGISFLVWNHLNQNTFFNFGETHINQLNIFDLKMLINLSSFSYKTIFTKSHIYMIYVFGE